MGARGNVVNLRAPPLGSLSEGAVKIGSSEPILTEGVTFVE